MERKKKLQKTAHAAPPEQPSTPLLSAPLPPRARPAPHTHTYHLHGAGGAPSGPLRLRHGRLRPSGGPFLFRNRLGAPLPASGRRIRPAPLPHALPARSSGGGACPPSPPPPPPSWRARARRGRKRRGGAVLRVLCRSKASQRCCSPAVVGSVPPCSGFFGPALSVEALINKCAHSFTTRSQVFVPVRTSHAFRHPCSALSLLLFPNRLKIDASSLAVMLLSIICLVELSLCNHSLPWKSSQLKGIAGRGPAQQPIQNY